MLPKTLNSQLLKRLQERAAEQNMSVEALLEQWLDGEGIPPRSNLFYQSETLLQQVSDAVIVTDRTLRITSWNTAAERIYGWSEAEALGQELDVLLKTEWTIDAQVQARIALIETGLWYGEIQQQTKTGQIRYIWASVSWLKDRAGQIIGGITVNHDITERKNQELLQTHLRQVLEAVATDQDLHRILEQLVLVIEQYQPDIKASVLLLDANTGQLRIGAAPNLPAAYNAEIDGVQIGSGVGSCGTAAYEKRLVIVEDIETDPLWVNYRDLALRHRLRACWSQPIIMQDGKVLGTFALYYSQPHSPVQAELELIQMAAHIAGTAIQHRHMEAGLRESEEKYRLIAENTSDGILIIDARTTKIMYASPSYDRQMGRDEGETIQHDGNDIYHLLHPDDRDETFKKIYDAIDQKQDHLTYSYRTRHNAGHYIWREDHVKFSYDSDGNHITTNVISRDISRRKQAEEALRASEERYKLLAELMSDYALSHRVNLDGSLETEWVVGDAFENVTGYQTPPGDYWDITHPDDIPRVLKDIEKTLQNQQTVTEYRIRKKDGDYLWISTSRQPIWDENEGRVVRYYNVVKNINERKLAEEALLRQNEYLTILHQMTLDLLNRRSTPDLLQKMVDHAARIMDAPYAEIMFVEGDEMIVKTCTASQAFVLGDRAKRKDASLTWQAYDTGQVITVDDYSSFPARRATYERLSLHAVACFPIMVGQTCMGVLDLSRSAPHYPFTPEQIQQGVLFSQLAALLLDNRQLYEDAEREITRRKQAEVALRTSEEQYRSLIESADAIISMVDQTGHYLFLNRLASVPFGKAPHELIGKTVFDLFLPDEAKQILRDVRTVIEQQQGMVKETSVIIEGEQHWFRTSIQPVRDSSGQSFAVMIYANEITDKKLAELALRTSEERYRLIVETSQEGIWTIDENGKTTFVNQRMADILGYQREAMVGHTLFDFMDDRGRTEAEPHLEHRQQGMASQHDFRFIRKDGTDVWVIVSINPLLNVDGQYTGALAMMVDITERKALEEQLRLRQAALESAANAILIARYDTTIEWVNPAFTTLTGYSLEEARGKKPSILKSGIQDAKFYQALWHKVHSGQVWQGRLINRRKDGSLYTEEQTITPVRDDSGKITHFIAIKQDITEREQAEQERLEQERLRVSLQKEQEQNALIQRIISALSHDLRTPLSVISTSKDILIRYFDRLNDQERREKLDAIGRQTQFALELLDDTISTIRGNMGERGLHLAPVNLAALCQISVNEIQQTTGIHHHLLFVTDGLVTTVVIDETIVSRILLNLLANAIKFSPGKSEIRLELNRREDWIVIRVVDQGVGISKDDLSHIFEPFYRAKSVRNVEGTGLGLNIVRDCVDRHHGRVEVVSQVGKGTTFMIELPLIEVVEV